MNKKVLITGGAGYIGSILTPLLLTRGFSVTVLDNLLFSQASLLDCCINPNFTFIHGDISDRCIMRKLLASHDVVIPLAAIVGAPACSQNPALAKLVNEEAPLWMLKQLSVDQNVVFPTTNSGYGVGEAESFCDESSPLHPISDYAKAKVKIEEAYLQMGNSVSFRLATVFGMSPRMRLDLLVNDFVYRAVKDRFIVLFEEHFRRNYIHIRDVAAVFSFGVDNFSNMKGQSFNVGLSTANLTKMQLCEKIKHHVPTFEIYVSAIGKDPDQRNYVVSNSKIESLGWAPRYTLDDGINELVKGYQIVKPNIYANA